MFHAVETVANTSACGHVAVQFRQERTGRDDWGEREDQTNGTETEQHRSIKSKMGLMKMMLLIPPQERWLMSAVADSHGHRMFWVRANEENTS